MPDFSFDIVSRVDMMEVKNAVDQAQKELAGRYDLKGTKCEIVAEKEDITLHADDEFRMDQVKPIMVSKLIKRGIDARQFEWGKLEPGAGISVKCKVTFKVGIDKDKAKPLIKQIKDKGLKGQAQIQGEKVCVTGKKRDDLQEAMAVLRKAALEVPLQFNNFRD